MCGAITAGEPYCVAHSAEAERQERQPWRAGYQDPAYRHARRQAIARARGRCEECGELLEGACEVDHVIPLSDGGENLVSNLMVRCLPCHRRKTAADKRRRRERGTA